MEDAQAFSSEMSSSDVAQPARKYLGYVFDIHRDVGNTASYAKRAARNAASMVTFVRPGASSGVILAHNHTSGRRFQFVMIN